MTALAGRAKVTPLKAFLIYKRYAKLKAHKEITYKGCSFPYKLFLFTLVLDYKN